jgi:hypothetical protein
MPYLDDAPRRRALRSVAGAPAAGAAADSAADGVPALREEIQVLEIV